MEYRLCPESTFAQQCEDVEDVEGWLREKLENALKDARVGKGIELDGEKVVVCGSSSGAHLALLTVRSPFSPTTP